MKTLFVLFVLCVGCAGSSNTQPAYPPAGRCHADADCDYPSMCVRSPQQEYGICR